MKYYVVQETKFNKFQDKVNQLIAEGWKPQGGVYAVIIALALGQWSYLQALIRED